MSALEENRAQLAKLQARMKEYQVQLKAETDSQRRAALKAKISGYRAAIRDVQVQIDHLDPPAARRARREQRKRLDIGALNFDFFERSGACWSDIEGHSWQQVEAGDFVELGTGMDRLQSWLAEGAQRLTDRQRLYIDAYYNRGFSLELIAQEQGVDNSTVARVIKNGMTRMQEWVEAKKLISTCADGKGGFDWKRYLDQVPVLTDRQRQLMLLVLSQFPKSQAELADKLEIQKSTVCRTLARAGHTIRRLDVRGGPPLSRPEIREWDQADKFSLALQTGMPLYFYYRFCFRGQQVGGVSRYNYELSRRREAGVSPEEVARELGLKPKTVRSAYSRLKRQCVQVGHIPAPKDGSIGARLDPETYVKLQRLVTGCAGT
ncbi:hypothetical protein D1641_10305 [Colidextribacter sp. OB.20]|uniref:helix-turn-helix domain-containing protein n=1 Tax=Colidextribacter sp. OB.20 TaxID=2304568 RepID=UPI001371B389|nr:helix-turn-helix domain-containing protein [Colidextribacter sp. OB.20]NBI10399.1 hypothetical protein [Colidextribacter sp. OB.20]